MKKTVLIVALMIHFFGWSQSPVATKHFREDGGILKEIIGNTTPTKTGTNTTLITDRKNQPNSALSLNGDYYQSTVGGNITGYSVSFFIKTSTNDNSVRSIVDIFSDHGIHLYLGNGKINAEMKYKFYYFGTAYVSSYNYNYGIKAVNDNEWHNVVYRFRIANANNAYIETFIDGVLDKSNIIVITNTNPYGYLGSTINTAIGTKNNNLAGSTHYEDGIDDIKFFNYTLSDDEIIKLAYDRETPKKIYVNVNAIGNHNGSSWSNAFTDLTKGLNYAVINNDELWVAKGTYYLSNSSRTNSFTSKAEIKIYGGFEGNETQLSDRNEALIFDTNATILSGDLNQDDDVNITFNNTTRDDNAYNVVTINKNNCILDGLVVSDGYADGTLTNTQYGAGIYKAEAVSNLILKRCKITNNVGHYGAGAYLVTNDNSNINIDRCIFENNLASLGASSFYSFLNTTATKILNFNITNSLFVSNKTTNDAVKNRNAIGASAGWIRAYSANTTINFQLVNNTFVNNINEGTGGGNYPTLGVSQRSATVGILNATIANNIFYGNKKNGNLTTQACNMLSTDSSIGNVSVYNSMDEDNFSVISSGNKFNVINGNPLLHTDFTLLSNSPALNNGDDSKIPAGISEDLYGNARIQVTAVDLGAIEGATTLTSNSFEKYKIGLYPNPVKNTLNISLQDNTEIQKTVIYDITGKQVKYQEGNVTSIAVEDLESGFYLLEVSINDKKEVRKFIKQ